MEHSDWLSPMVIAPKKQTNKIQGCVNFRALNKVTIKDGFPMPFCERVLEDVAGGDTPYTVSWMDLVGTIRLPFTPSIRQKQRL